MSACNPNRTFPESRASCNVTRRPSGVATLPPLDYLSCLVGRAVTSPAYDELLMLLELAGPQYRRCAAELAQVAS